jgi:predicted alpha/beta superfamily hydrolase
MKRIKVQLFFLLTVYTFCVGQTPEPLIIGEIRTIHSKILKEDRKLDIYLPDNYKTSHVKYPVLFVLDSPDNLLSAIGVVDNLKRSSQSIPDMIVVGIENTFRNRDFANTKKEGFVYTENGGADNYYKHLTAELMPFIDSSYRTQDFRLLYGHSLSASFAIYSMFKDPNKINACFAVDPAFWVDTSMLTTVFKILDKTDKLDNYLYFSLSRECDMDAIPPIMQLYKDLDIKYINKLTWDFSFYKKEDHFSSRLRSFEDGFENYFADYKIPFQYEDTYRADLIIQHIDKAQLKYKINSLYPERVLNKYANRFYRHLKYDESIRLLNKNKETYFESKEIYYLLGLNYEALNEKDKAIVNYEKSLSLGGDKKLRDKIIELKKK